MNIIILYPGVFNSYTKFERKVSRILSNLQNFKVFAPHDSNGFIAKFFQEDPRCQELSVSKEQKILCTHAIVFDDGEEFRNEINKLQEDQVKIRVVSIKITRVLNVYVDKQYQGLKSDDSYEYIGRGSYWGNPYSMFDNGDSREDVIQKFKYDFDNDKFVRKDKKEVYKLAGKRLGCFCKPEACHGDILADFLNSWDDGE